MYPSNKVFTISNEESRQEFWKRYQFRYNGSFFSVTASFVYFFTFSVACLTERVYLDLRRVDLDEKFIEVFYLTRCLLSFLAIESQIFRHFDGLRISDSLVDIDGLLLSEQKH